MCAVAHRSALVDAHFRVELRSRANAHIGAQVASNRRTLAYRHRTCNARIWGYNRAVSDERLGAHHRAIPDSDAVSNDDAEAHNNVVSNPQITTRRHLGKEADPPTDGRVEANRCSSSEHRVNANVNRLCAYFTARDGRPAREHYAGLDL
jgi:hypothetical protein